MNIIQEKNWVITTKKDKGKLPIFCGNVERVIPIYAQGYHQYYAPEDRQRQFHVTYESFDSEFTVHKPNGIVV